VHIAVAQGGATAPPPADVRGAVAVPAVGTVTIDGRLDEATWGLASPAADFVQQQPADGRPATLQTEVRLLYDSTNLYVGAMLFDSEPSELLVNELRRDFEEADNDLFGVVLDTFREGRNAYGFIVNPGGAQRETLAYDQGEREDASWNASWRAATHVMENGWSVEMAIPWSALRLPGALDQEWGLNLVRVMPAQ
jgi:hypothetical protein